MVAVPRPPGPVVQRVRAGSSGRGGLERHRDARRSARSHARLRRALRGARRRARAPGRSFVRRHGGRGDRRRLSRARAEPDARLAPRPLARRRAVGRHPDLARRRARERPLARPGFACRPGLDRGLGGRSRRHRRAGRVAPAPLVDGEVRVADSRQGASPAPAPDRRSDASRVGRRGSREPGRLRRGVAAAQSRAPRYACSRAVTWSCTNRPRPAARAVVELAGS